MHGLKALGGFRRERKRETLLQKTVAACDVLDLYCTARLKVCATTPRLSCRLSGSPLISGYSGEPNYASASAEGQRDKTSACCRRRQMFGRASAFHCSGNSWRRARTLDPKRILSSNSILSGRRSTVPIVLVGFGPTHLL